MAASGSHLASSGSMGMGALSVASDTLGQQLGQKRPAQQEKDSLEPREVEADFYIRVAILGDAGVGKSSLLLKELGSSPRWEQYHLRKVETQRLWVDQVPEIDSPVHSIGIVFRSKIYKYGDTTFHVQYWDAPGMSAYLKYTARLCAGAVGVILVFDLNDPSSFQHLEDWVMELDRSGDTLFKVLIGNKGDLAGKQADGTPAGNVSEEEALEFAARIEAPYFAISATNEEQVHAAFASMVGKVANELTDPPQVSQLLRKNVRFGARLSSELNIEYRKKLYQRMISHHPETLTDNMDWVS